jgi:enediyne biosynthesis protein E4
MRRWRAFAVLLCGFAAAAPAQIAFEDATAASGIAFTLNNGATGRFRQVELMPGGVAAFDFDGDGCLDIYFTNGAALPSLRKTGPEFSNSLYRGACDGTFEDVTAKAGVGGEGYSMAVAAADFDNDGHADLFVAGVNRNILYRNRGDGTFEDITGKANITGVDPRLGKMWSVAAGWFDFDNDGYLDLFIVNYVQWDPRSEPRCGTDEHPLYCHPDNYRGLPNQLFRNNGDGTFSDISRSSGLMDHIGKGMGLAFADFNGDGWTDVYVANDSVRGFLFENQGGKRFAETGLENGVALREDGAAIAGMGVDFRDYDNDGLPDIVVTGMINDTFLLFRNAGPDLPFDDESIRSGLGVLTRQLTGWAVGFVDFDNDGWKDIFSANAHFPQLGRFLRGEAKLPNTVFQNQAGKRFGKTPQTGGLEPVDYFHGAAFGDFDNDGLVDVAVTALNGPARLLRNVSTAQSNWLGVRLVGTRSNRDGLGAKVMLELPGGRKLYNHATTAAGYASSSEQVVRFGLGAANAVETLEVRWPGGAVQRLTGVETNQIVTVEEEGPPGE